MAISVLRVLHMFEGNELGRGRDQQDSNEFVNTRMVMIDHGNTFRPLCNTLHGQFLLAMRFCNLRE